MGDSPKYRLELDLTEHDVVKLRAILLVRIADVESNIEQAADLGLDSLDYWQNEHSIASRLLGTVRRAHDKEIRGPYLRCAASRARGADPTDREQCTSFVGHGGAHDFDAEVAR